MRTVTTRPSRAEGAPLLRAAALLLLAILCSPGSLAHAQAVRRAEGLAALVGGSAPGPNVLVVLESDVVFMARLRLAGRASGELPLGPLPDTLLRATLEEIVGQLLIVREAERLRASLPSRADVVRQRARVAELAGGEARLTQLMRALGVREAEVTAIARRRATVERFLRANLAGADAVTDEDVERAYEAGGHPFIGQPLEEVREAMRVLLTRRALERAVSRWVGVLEQRTTVSLLAPYATST